MSSTWIVNLAICGEISGRWVPKRLTVKVDDNNDGRPTEGEVWEAGCDEYNANYGPQRPYAIGLINFYRAWACPAGHDPNVGIICGGDHPHWRRLSRQQQRTPNNDLTLPNIYFYLDLANGETRREVHGDLDFELDDEDWKELFKHAENNGCINEPQCPECGGHLI